MTESKLFIDGSEGQLQAIELIPDDARDDLIAIVCHPHPLHNGTMHNKVVTTMARMLRDMQIVSLRFNYRGVGESAGHYGEIIGESADMQAVIKHLQAQYPERKFILCGFSFGSYIAFQGKDYCDTKAIISISPPVSRMPFSEHDLPQCPWLIVQGEEDDVVSPKEVYDYVESLSPHPDLMRFTGTGHFYHGKLIELSAAVAGYLQKHLT